MNYHAVLLKRVQRSEEKLIFASQIKNMSERARITSLVGK